MIRVRYDPKQLSFHDVLTIFFATHDPTTLNAQGADKGEQYRSVILPTSGEQKVVADATIKEFAPLFAPKKIVTTIESLSGNGKFWPAENHHQNYYAKNTEGGYCSAVIDPKLKVLRKKCDTLLK